MMKRRSTINRAREARWALSAAREVRARGVDLDCITPAFMRDYARTIGKNYGFGRWRWLHYRLATGGRV